MELKNCIQNRKLTQSQMDSDDCRIRRAAKAMREYLILSKEQFAEKLGVSSRLISYLENGERIWSDDLLKKLETFQPCTPTAQ